MLRVNVVDVRSSVRVTNVVTRVLLMFVRESGSPMWWMLDAVMGPWNVRVTNVVTGMRDAVVVRGTSGSPMW